jgi:hypothetical protein
MISWTWARLVSLLIKKRRQASGLTFPKHPYQLLKLFHLSNLPDFLAKSAPASTRILPLSGTLHGVFRHWHKDFRPVVDQTKQVGSA